MDADADVDALFQRIAEEEGLTAGSGGDLFRGEYFWRDHQPWLKEQGYILRPRYDPEWKPSWEGTNKSYESCEDGQYPRRFRLLDAVRASDNSYVMLKRVGTEDHPFEIEIAQYFQSPELRDAPENHCVPILDTLVVPDDEEETIIVLPMLRQYDDPPFETVKEGLDFIQQILEGVLFMHRNGVAHRDINHNNVMMDPSSLYPDSYHPIQKHLNRDFKGEAFHYSRTQKPPKYYLIDFGISRRYPLDMKEPSEEIIQAGDKSVPEHNGSSNSCNPFPTDVYTLGNMIRRDFLRSKRRFEFLAPLVVNMVKEDPKTRHDMEKVVSEFHRIRSSLSSRTLGARVADRDEFLITTLYRDLRYYGRRLITSFSMLQRI